jgi:hypothetical protein
MPIDYGPGLDKTWCRRCQLSIPHEVEHGSNNAYTYHRCGCKECKAAHVKTQQDSAKKASQKRLPRGTHGTSRGYDYYGCRKKCCRDAKTIAQKESRERRAKNRAVTRSLFAK